MPADMPRYMTTSAANGEVVDLDPLAIQPAPTEEEDPDILGAAPGTVLKVKHLDEVLDLATGQWNMKPTPPSETVPPRKGGKYDAYAFTVIRKFTPTQMNGQHNHSGQGFLGRQPSQSPSSFTMTKLIEIHSIGLKEVGQEVIGQIPGVSWTAKPLRVCAIPFQSR